MANWLYEEAPTTAQVCIVAGTNRKPRIIFFSALVMLNVMLSEETWEVIKNRWGSADAPLAAIATSILVHRVGPQSLILQLRS